MLKRKTKRITIEFESRGWTYRIVGVPGFVNQETGEELIAGRAGLQLLNVLKRLSGSLSSIKSLPKAEVEIKFSRVA